MTALATAPIPTLATRDTATPLGRAIRVTGYGRVGVGALAAGTHLGVPARLVLPVERVAAIDLRLRLGGIRHVVTANGPGRLATIAQHAATAALADVGCGPHEAHLDLRLPIRSSTGTDVCDAVALAAIDAVSSACEYPLSPARRSLLAAAAAPGASAGLAANGPAVVAADGTLLYTPVEMPRLRVVLVHPEEPAGAAEAAADATFGRLTVPEQAPATPAELAAWLVACGGGAQHPVIDVVRERVDPGAHLGVVGGQVPLAPVSVLLDPADLAGAQMVLLQLAGHLPSGWRASVTITSST